MRSTLQEPARLNQAPIGSGAYTIDFLEAHHGLSTEFWQSPCLCVVRREMNEEAARQRRNVEGFRRLEQSFCWLLCAAIFIVVGIVCLQHFSAHKTNLTGAMRMQSLQHTGAPSRLCSGRQSGTQFRQTGHEMAGL